MKAGIFVKLGIAAVGVLLIVGTVALVDRTTTGDPNSASVPDSPFRGKLGKGSSKIRREGDRTYVWADGPMNATEGEWYDFTGSPFDPEELQYGIGRDRIRSIDDPLFVLPDDQRLLNLAPDPYRPPAPVASVDDVRAIGVARNGDARAYPVALLSHHELVNDTVGGKPVTVGW